MDHETALESANQALSGGGGLRATSRFASVELRDVDELRRSRGPANLDEGSRLPSGAWEVAAMLAVGVLTVVFIVTMWLL